MWRFFRFSIVAIWMLPLFFGIASAAESAPPVKALSPVPTIEALQAEYHVIHDVALLAFLMIGLGVALAPLIRIPERNGETRGKVPSHLFRVPDLAMGAVLLAFPGAAFFVHAAPTELPKEIKIDLTTAVASMVPPMVMLFLVLIMATWVIRRSPDEVFGLRRVGFWKGFGLILVWGIPAVFLVNFFGMALQQYWIEPQFGGLDAQDPVKMLIKEKDPLIRFFFAFAACVVAPVAEETLFRGYLYGVMKRYAGRFFATVAISMLFAVVHLKLPALAPLALLAVILTLAYEQSGSLWVPIGIHALFNTATVVAIFFFPEYAGA